MHLASQEGHANVIKFLLNCNVEFKENKDHLTFIDLAIKNKQQAALMAIISHERWEEALDLTSTEFKTPFIGIIQMSSEVTQAIMERCITRYYFDENNEKKYSVNFNN